MTMTFCRVILWHGNTIYFTIVKYIEMQHKIVNNYFHKRENNY